MNSKLEVMMQKITELGKRQNNKDKEMQDLIKDNDDLKQNIKELKIKNDDFQTIIRYLKKRDDESKIESKKYEMAIKDL